MAVLDEYILRAARLLSGDTDEDVDALCCEIMQVFDLNYTNPEALKYINSSSSFRYSKSDLGMILQKLRLRREESDDKAYGSPSCVTITQHIRRLEQALEEGMKGDELKAVYDSIDYVYANARGCESYTDGLVAYGFSGTDLSEGQTRLRIDKLKFFRDEKMMSLKMAETQGATYNLSANSAASASSTVEISLEIINGRIDEIDDDDLTDEDKTRLKGLLADLSTKNDQKRKEKLQKLIHWLGDKGPDIFIAVLPYIAKVFFGV